MLVGEEDMEGDVLTDELVAGAVAEVTDRVHSRCHVTTGRVDRDANWCHPSEGKLYKVIKGFFCTDSFIFYLLGNQQIH